MAKTKFRELVAATMTPAQQKRAARRTQELMDDMPLAELRHARALTQAALAQLLETSQPEVSKIEKRTDMYLSTLRSYVEAMGGKLEVIARFPDGAVRITQFEESESLDRRLTPV